MVLWFWQPQFLYSTMPRKGKKKVQAVEDDPEVEVIMRVEIVYEDIKPVTGANLELK